MKVCITEKPSVGRDIAKILGADVRRDGYFEGNGWQVTWTFGHLCSLKEPHDYTPMWRRWSLSQLPMLPERFSIKVMDDPGVQRQFNIIRQLVSQAEEVINCGDAGQEGELIQRWVMQLAGVKCPVKRLWISSLTDDAIRQGFADLRPSEDFDNLYFAGMSRAIGDWILGMNATRLYSLRCSEPGKVLSIGRVQTPTLALIVKRQQEIDNFRPEDFWELQTTYRDTRFDGVGMKFATEEEARKRLDEIRPHPLVITDVKKKQGREAPPRLFDLTSLQVETNKSRGWSADYTLRLIQSLYEKKVTTYPRVDTTYLSEDLYPKIPAILQSMTPYAPQTAPLLQGKLQKSKKVFDNAKVTDHHAIIPTGASPRVLEGDEKILYHIVALRFIAVFYPDCRFQQTTVDAMAGDTPFRVTGKVIEDPGWRALYDNKTPQSADSEDKVLPPFTVGESGPHTPTLKKKTTQPPKLYTEGTLLRAMETAGRTVDDEELRDAMKENGIGRPSTRAAIIETLFKRGYIERRKKSIAATSAGMALIGGIRDELLKSAKLTGIWENKLRRIERGEYHPGDFIMELKMQISEIVLNVLSDNTVRRINIDPPSSETPTPSKPAQKPRAPRVTRYDQILCPSCGEGHLLKGRTAWGCSRYQQGCRMLLPFAQYPADLTPGKLNSAVKKLKR